MPTHLDALLLNVIGFSQAGIDLLAPSKDNLIAAINILEPTTNLLLKYNPSTPACCWARSVDLDNGGYAASAAATAGRSVVDAALLLGNDPYRYPDNLPIVAAKGGPGGKPGCGSLPDVAKNFPVRQLITNTGWGTGLDIRPNPGIGHPVLGQLLPGHPRGAGAAEHPRCIPGRRRSGPVPYPGAPPYGAPLYGPGRHAAVAGRAAGAARRRDRRATPAPNGRPAAMTADDRSGAGDAAVRDNLGGAVWRLGIFVAVCCCGVFALFAVFAQLRFEKEKTYIAEFTNVTGLEDGDFVRIAGVEVGKVKKISIRPGRDRAGRVLRRRFGGAHRGHQGRRSATTT